MRITACDKIIEMLSALNTLSFYATRCETLLPNSSIGMKFGQPGEVEKQRQIDQRNGQDE